ncbi:MAG: molybdate ABC transporter substrate-binding protein [Rubrivivax sp.]|nr:molybdate ABC transporter substrate-binding protein [Rubrivivax sp.]
MMLKASPSPRLQRLRWLSLAAVFTAAVLLQACAQMPAVPPAAPAAPTPAAAAAAAPLTVHAAGSLRAVMTDLAKAYETSRSGAVRPVLSFAPSGLLRERIAAGEASQVFASANMEHPRALHTAGRAEPVQAFTRNALCGLATPPFSLQGRTLAQRLLDSNVRVATSTPRADPAGDYAFEMFDRIESSGAGPAGSAQALKGKALQLAGGPQSPQPPAGHNLYAWLMAEGRADIFITYCTNAVLARQEVAGLQVLPVPDAINVSAVYGITAVNPASEEARRFIRFVLSDPGQQILARYGFSRP